MKLIAILMLALVPYFSAPMSAVAEAKAEAGKHFFEPTQDDWNCCAVEIVAQQARYAAAKKAGDYDIAKAEAVWHFQIAWLINNEAFDLITAKDASIADVQKALTLLSGIGKVLDQAEQEAHHADEWQDCRVKAGKNLAAAQERFKALEKSK
jgi:hypothetical protein